MVRFPHVVLCHFDQLFKGILHFPSLWGRRAADNTMKSAAWLLLFRGLFLASILISSRSNLKIFVQYANPIPIARIRLVNLCEYCSLRLRGSSKHPMSSESISRCAGVDAIASFGRL